MDHKASLERLRARISTANAGLAYMDMWEHGGRASATPEVIAQMEADVAETTRELDAAKAELRALVTKLRAEAPEQLEAHESFIAQVLD